MLHALGKVGPLGSLFPGLLHSLEVHSEIVDLFRLLESLNLLLEGSGLRNNSNLLESGAISFAKLLATLLTESLDLSPLLLDGGGLFVRFRFIDLRVKVLWTQVVQRGAISFVIVIDILNK